ncbi:MAG: hypothetical protein FWH21_03115 [Kiritimatiellaeota bacterium]|nr:hypothetical protein [Kiritimatiellota bacterium]
MKRRIILCIGMTIVTVVAFATETTELKRVENLNVALQDGGIAGLLAVARDIPVPRIPSKWHIEARMKGEEKIRVATAARDFGFALVERLEEVAKHFQELPPTEELCAETHKLLDLMEWCAVADGIGNLLLAQRCRDIAAIGLGRVTANLDFPLDECKRLASRMSSPPDWASVAKRCRVLDTEAGVNLFVGCKDSEDMASVMRAGSRLRYPQWKDLALQMKKEGKDVPDEIFREDDIRPKSILQATGDFFEMQVGWDSETPFTCRTRWDRRNHDYYLVDTGSQLAQKALGLLRFREEVGYFPEKYQRTSEEIAKRDAEIIEAAKWGRKVNRFEDDPNYDPLAEAFRLAWRNRPNIDKKNTKDYNSYVPAYQAYTEIASGTFYDRDTANIQDIEQRKRRQREREQNPVIPTPEQKER